MSPAGFHVRFLSGWPLIELIHSLLPFSSGHDDYPGDFGYGGNGPSSGGGRMDEEEMLAEAAAAGGGGGPGHPSMPLMGESRARKKQLDIH